MKFLASILIAIAMRLDRKRFYEQAEREARLQKQVGDLLFKYHNEQTGPLFENAPNWTEQDAGNLTAFLKTESGRTLAKRFKVVAGNACVMGCGDEMHTTYAAGNGNGWNEACQWFLKLSRVTGVQATKHDEQAPEGGAQLLERFSP